MHTVVTKASKYPADSRKICQLEKFSGASLALVPHLVGFRVNDESMRYLYNKEGLRGLFLSASV